MHNSKESHKTHQGISRHQFTDTARLDYKANNVINLYHTAIKGPFFKNTQKDVQTHTLSVNPGAICYLAGTCTDLLSVHGCASVCLRIPVCTCL